MTTKKKPKRRTKRAPRTTAYLRVSTADQDNEKFKTDIRAFANKQDFGKVEFHEEKVSTRVPWKERKIGALIDELQSGDRLILPEITRLSRSAFELFAILQIALDKEIAIYSIKEGWNLNGSIQSKIVAMAFGMAGEIEHALEYDAT